MKILITGGTGLVGSIIVVELRKRGHSVNILVRKRSTRPDEFYWNYKKGELDDAAFEGIDCIIHLAGASIGNRWTREYKEEIISSRVDSAKFLYDRCKFLDVSLQSFISASGINYYGTFTSDRILDEESDVLRADFLSNVCRKWESAALHFADIAEKTVILRTAPVLSQKGGTLEKLNKITDLNLASGIGNGNQWFNWIHLDDLVNMYIEAVENPEMRGINNAAADEIPTNAEFMRTLAQVRNKFFLPVNVPSFVIQAALGEMSEMILQGTRVSNKKIKSLGFDFKYDKLRESLVALR